MRRLILSIGLVACTDTEPDPPGPPWEQRTELPGPRLEAAATANGTRLVVLGGFTTSALAITSDVLQFDPFAEPDEAWTTLPEAPVAWTHAALVGVGGSLYLLGGLEGATLEPRGQAFLLRSGAMAWEELAPMPAGMERGAAAVLHTPGHIFLFGGETAAGPTATVLDYVIADNAWQELPAMPSPRSHAAVMRREDGTFIVAGGTATQGPLGDVHALVPGEGWMPREPMPAPRAGCAYGVVYGVLVCAGGETVVGGNVVPSRETLVYDPRLNTWTVKPEMPAERAGAASAVVTSRLYVVGGSPTAAPEPTTSLYELDLLDTVPR